MDAITLVEAAYQVRVPTQQWLSQIVAEARPIFAADGGAGSVGLVIDATRTTATSPHLLGMAMDGIPGEAHAVFSDMIQLGIQPDAITRIRCAGPVSTLSVALGGSFNAGGFRECLYRNDFGDAGHVVAGDPAGVCCVLGTTFRRTHEFSAERRWTWQLLAAHIAAGMRLRDGSAADSGDASQIDAIIETDGTIAHARGAARSQQARERLAGAARDILRARGSLRRRDPLHALELWQGLVAGRWSIVDRLESDGRHFLLACRNEPHARNVRALTAREAQVATLVGLGHANKVVAYELGIELSSVATYLRRALKKLRLTQRRELITLLLQSVP